MTQSPTDATTVAADPPADPPADRQTLYHAANNRLSVIVASLDMILMISQDAKVRAKVQAAMEATDLLTDIIRDLRRRDGGNHAGA